MGGKTRKCLVTLESRQVGHHHHISSPSQHCHVHLFFKLNGQNHSLHLTMHLHKDNGSTCQTHVENASMPDLSHTHHEPTSFAFQRTFPACFLHFSSLVYSLTSRKRNGFCKVHATPDAFSQDAGFASNTSSPTFKRGSAR